MNDDLTDWLKEHKELLGGKVLIDVGAYHGDFTRAMIELDVFQACYLFEPNPQNLEFLHAQELPKSTKIIDRAVGNQVTESTFYSSKDLATGSRLKYAKHTEKQSEIKSFPVKQVTLDLFVSDLQVDGKVGLIKVDTQGYDLNVLKGASHILEKDRPWLVVELIFSHLYDEQAMPWEIWQWCADNGYEVAGVFNEHCTSDGFLAFADSVLIPKEVVPSVKQPFHPKRSSIQDAEIKMLRNVCDERLELINELHSENAKRLEIINKLSR